MLSASETLFVRTGTTGFVREKTMLVTRIVTFQNEVVTIPNGSILATPTLNYTQMAASKGLILTVEAGIGYDVDWRTVQHLMIEGACRTGTSFRIRLPSLADNPGGL